MKIKFYNQKNTLLETADGKSRNSENCQIFAVNNEIIAKAGKTLTLKIEVPLLDIHGYWTPYLFRPVMQQHWVIEFSCAAHRNFPYLSFFNLDQKNRATIGVSNLYDDSIVSARMNQQTGNYDVEIKISIGNETREFAVFIDTSERNWTEISADYRVFARPEWKPSYPAAAWLPVYCTWYAVHASVEKGWLEKQAEAAADMGFGTFIVDDGWCFDDFKRVCPETIGSWYERIGDWEISEKKLPGFKQHVEKVQALGLKYLLWVSPFMVGGKSRFRKEVDCSYLSELHEGYQVFDPECEEAASRSMELMKKTVDNYGLDGLKIDFVDAVPQSLETPHGRAVYGYMKNLTESIKKENPEALFEFRQRYSTPQMLDIGTQFRAGDAPFDFIENLHRIAQIRVCLGDGVPVHADPVYWHPAESNVNIAKHMICSLAGVPMVSADLNELPENQRKIIEYWLQFYLRHIETFKNGHWQINYRFDFLSSINVSFKSEKITFLCSSPHEPEELKNSSIILNLSAKDIECDGFEIYNCLGEKINSKSIPQAGYAAL